MSKFSLWLTYSTCKNAKRKPQQKISMCVNYTTVAGTKFYVEICTVDTSNYGFKAGWTPLTYAALHGHVVVLWILLEAAGSRRTIELASIRLCGRGVWKCEVVALMGGRRWFFWIRAQHAATLPSSKYKTSDVVKVLVERVADIRSNGVGGASTWESEWRGYNVLFLDFVHRLTDT